MFYYENQESLTEGPFDDLSGDYRIVLVSGETISAEIEKVWLDADGFPSCIVTGTGTYINWASVSHMTPEVLPATNQPVLNGFWDK